MEIQPHLLLFGDQTVETLSSIQNLIRQSRTSPSILRFLREATDVVQTQASKLDIANQRRFLGFETILDLAERYDEQDTPDDLVATVLMCIAQLGELMIHAERDPSILNSSGSSVYIIGLCTGLLPAAAAATARDTSDLIRIGMETIAVAFRLGLEASRRSRQIEEVPGCWGVTVISVAPEEQQVIIDAFNREKNIPSHRQIYISVEAQTWATISGPPAVLADLFSYSPVLGSATKITLPFGAPAHAEHLQPVDIEKIVGLSPIQNTAIKHGAYVMSTSLCKPFTGQDLGSIMYQATEDVLQYKLCLSGTIQGVVSELASKRAVKLTALGPTTQLGTVKNALEAGGIDVTVSGPAKAVPTDNIRGGSDLVAIVGMSGRFPGSEGLQEFWKNLQDGRDMHSKIPKRSFDIATHYDPTGATKNTTTVPYGCFLENPALFDSRLFNVSPREAAQMDPIQRLLLMTSYEALEMAGYSQDATLATQSKRIATYFGQAADDWREMNCSQDVDVYYIPATVRAFAPGRLNYHYKWAGASYSVDSACASSSTAVMLACNDLIARNCDTALAGGGSMLTSPGPYAGLSRANFLSTTGGCKTFADSADGYCRGEGVGVVVLKRLEDAVSDNDNILAVVRGAARNYSASATSITHPSVEAQQSLYRSLLQKACVEPDEVGFVEMHGTATQAGDFAEMTSVTGIFGKGRSKSNPLVVGALKANVGHGEAAAGITSLIKTVLMLKNSAIPPQPGMPIKLNHNFPPLEKMNVRIADEKLPFNVTSRRGDGRRKILLNNFDAAGGNTSLLIEDAPARAPKNSDDARSCHVVTVSARTLASLKMNTKRLLEYLKANPNTKLSDLAYTTTARRMHETLRSAYPVKSIGDLVRLLSIDAEKKSDAKPASKASVVFAFTGQASQYAGMGKELFASNRRFRESILSYQSLCQWQGFPSFVDLVSSGKTDMKSKTTTQIQLAIVAVEIALADLWRSWGVEPAMVMGHSLGEYAALCTAGVLSVSDALYLVGKRAMMIQEKCTIGSHSMLAVAASTTECEKEMKAFPNCQVSCKNGPSATVVSGSVEDIRALRAQLTNNGTSTTLLQIPYGFHSPQIDPILADYEACAQGVHFNKPQIPVASTLKGSIVVDAGVFGPAYLVQQARQPVNFVGALEASKSAGLVDDKTMWIEIGPQPVCLKMIRSTLEVAPVKLVSTLTSVQDNWETVSIAAANAYTAGISVNWQEFHKEHINSLSLLELPTYAFDLKEYWIQYEGDWALKQQKTTATPVAAPTLGTSTVPGFPTTTMQRVAKESFEGKNATVTFESMTSEPNLLSVIQGHLVNGVALCPSSVYTDMAYTAASYIYQSMKPGEKVPPMSVSNLAVTHPLIPRPEVADQTIVVTAVKSESDWTVDVSFGSKEGSSTHEHGQCRIIFGNAQQWKAEWAKSSYFINTAKDALIRDALTGNGHRLQKSIVYKLFANLVVYDDAFQAIEEVCLEDNFSNAVASLKLRPLTGTGNFTFSPHWIDSILHVAGFVLNGKPMNDDDTFYISTGFESLRVSEALAEGKPYTSYVHMGEEDKKGNIIGDVYIFDGQDIIGMCTGVVFQKMNRVVLDHVIGKAPLKSAPTAPTMLQKSVIQKSLALAETVVSKTRESARLQVRDDTSRRARSTSRSGSDTGYEYAMSSTACSSVGDEETCDAELVIDAVLAQTGFDRSELEDSTTWATMGLDSLMTIEVIGAIKKTTGMVLPAAFFTHNPTVGDVHRAIGNVPVDVTPPSTVGSGGKTDDAEVIIDAVLAQTGFDREDVEPSTSWAAMGLDSLMTIEVIAAIKKTADIVLPAAFFNHNPTVADVRRLMGNEVQEQIPAPPRAASHAPKVAEIMVAPAPASANPAIQPSKKLSADNSKALSSSSSNKAVNPYAKYQSNVVLIQGSSKSNKTPVFLIADGSGSATSYIHLPAFAAGLPVYALESPFLHAPEEYTCTIEEIADLFLTAIRKTRASGPYIIGGWSAGAVYAYEVSRRLLDAGEQVPGLLLLDMHVPKPVANPLEPTLELLELTGLTTGVNRAGFAMAPMSATLKEHLLATVKALLKYDPAPMHPTRRPGRTHIIWATLGLAEVLGEMPTGFLRVAAEHEMDDETKTWLFGKSKETRATPGPMEDLDSGMLAWFYGKRSDFGAKGWQEMVGDGIDCFTVECDHFSMVNPPHAKVTGGHMKKAVGAIIADMK